MRRHAMLMGLLSAVVVLLSSACSREPALLTPEEHNHLKNLREGSHVMAPKDAVIAAASIGRFQRFENGERTWLLDTSTGTICILLTSVTDWAKDSTKDSACTKVLGKTSPPTLYQEYLERPQPNQQRK